MNGLNRITQATKNWSENVVVWVTSNKKKVLTCWASDVDEYCTKANPFLRPFSLVAIWSSSTFPNLESCWSKSGWEILNDRLRTINRAFLSLKTKKKKKVIFSGGMFQIYSPFLFGLLTDFFRASFNCLMSSGSSSSPLLFESNTRRVDVPPGNFWPVKLIALFASSGSAL